MDDIIEFRLKRMMPLKKELIVNDQFSNVRNIVTQYTWVPPTKDNMDLIIESLSEVNADKILDIGCGSGFWTKFLNKKGFDAKGIKLEIYTETYFGKLGVDNKKNLLDKENCEIKDFYELDSKYLSQFDTFLLFWPPYNSSLALDVLKKYIELKDVKNLLYIGEIYGCNGDDDFCDLITDEEVLKKYNINTKEYLDFDTYPGLHDYGILLSKSI